MVYSGGGNRVFPALFWNRMIWYSLVQFGKVVGMVMEITKMPGGDKFGP